MSVNDRLQTMEALWDSLTHESVEIKSPKWHEETLLERKEKIERGNASFISLDEYRRLQSIKEVAIEVAEQDEKNQTLQPKV